MERLKAKSEALEARRRAEVAARAAAEADRCTFAPELPVCPDFIHRLAEGFRLARPEDRPSARPSAPPPGRYSSIGPPEWQSVGACDGSVRDPRWGKMVVAEPEAVVRAMRREALSSSSLRGACPHGHGAFEP